MSTSFASRRAVVTIAACAFVAMTAAGCDGCSLTPLSSSSSASAPTELAGSWVVNSYAVDHNGCTPARAPSPMEGLEITLQESSDDDSPLLEILSCPSDDHCLDEATPEDQLRWDEELKLSRATHYSATLHHPDGVDTTCRLSTQQTVLLVEGSTLELTRSFYEIDLPTEGDEVCSAELAEEYHPHKPCVRSETYELTRREQEEPTS